MFAKKRNFGPQPKYELVEKHQPKSNEFVFISGSCSVESREQVLGIAPVVKAAGATHLRGGVFRAGTYPSDKVKFGWVAESLIQSFCEAAKTNGLKNIIEVLEYSDESLKLIEPYCDVFQVGARSMQNYSLLRKLGKYGKPVFLKRNTGATLDEWLGAAEHLLCGGVEEIYLIERGSSTFLNHVRWDLSLSLIPAVKQICNIPVIVDASHGTGRRDLVPAMTLAGVAAGAAGCLVECHHDPENSLSDAEQAISPKELYDLSQKINKVREAIK
jgi:3-deoxy-7-phosphoheptulonate synthase